VARPALALRLALVALCATLHSGCRVVPDEPADGAAADAGHRPAQGFEAGAWAASVWSDKVVPYFEKDAVDLAPVLVALRQDADQAGEKYGRRADAEGSPWSFAVKGTGKVVSADTASRAGVVVVAVDTAAGPQEVTLQVGPVIRGTAVRDSLPFFSFGDVKNQIEFAQVSRALNDRAAAAVRPHVEEVKAPGTRVAFSGAMNVTGTPDALLITPLTLARVGGN
jgi:predicted lipoprotein